MWKRIAGTWTTTAIFPDGAGLGTWDGTHTMK